jgi:hypothetical protein
VPAHRRFAWQLGLALCLCLSEGSEGAAQAGGSLDLSSTGVDAATRFTGQRWAQIRPPRDFEGGCVVGFLAFRFDATGYFIYNNHVRGAWWLDELGNLRLRTRDGVRFTLIVEGNTLRPNKNLPFMKRTDLFQRCGGAAAQVPTTDR